MNEDSPIYAAALTMSGKMAIIRTRRHDIPPGARVSVNIAGHQFTGTVIEVTERIMALKSWDKVQRDRRRRGVRPNIAVWLDGRAPARVYVPATFWTWCPRARKCWIQKRWPGANTVHTDFQTLTDSNNGPR